MNLQLLLYYGNHIYINKDQENIYETVYFKSHKNNITITGKMSLSSLCSQKLSNIYTKGNCDSIVSSDTSFIGLSKN